MLKRITYLLLIVSIGLSSCTIQKRKHLSGYDVKWTGKTHLAKANRMKKEKALDVSSVPELKINEQAFDSTTGLTESNELLADKSKIQVSKPEKQSYKLPYKSFKKEQAKSKYRKWKKRLLPNAPDKKSSGSSGSTAKTLAILGLIFTIVGLLFFPLFIAGGILSIIAWSKGSTMGMIMSIIFIVIFVFFIALLFWVLSNDGTVTVGF